MRYMILTFASQQDYQEIAGRPSERPAWTPEEYAAIGAFMEAYNQELLDSGELVETRGLSAPVHTRRVGLQEGAPVVTDGPYAEAEEVLAGYWGPSRGARGLSGRRPGGNEPPAAAVPQPADLPARASTVRCPDPASTFSMNRRAGGAGRRASDRPTPSDPCSRGRTGWR